MLPLITLIALISAPFLMIFVAEIAHEVSRAKQARNFGRMMSDPRVVAAHRAAEQCKTKAKA